MAGPVICPSKKGLNFSPTMMPRNASMATRPCFNSAFSRLEKNGTNLFSEFVFLKRKKKKTPKEGKKKKNNKKKNHQPL